MLRHCGGDTGLHDVEEGAGRARHRLLDQLHAACPASFGHEVGAQPGDVAARPRETGRPRPGTIGSPIAAIGTIGMLWVAFFAPGERGRGPSFVGR